MMFNSKTARILLTLTATCASQTAHAHSIAIGDGNISSSPQKGYVFACKTNFNPNAPGAQASGAWLDEAAKTWDPELKPYVNGNVSWPSEISVTYDGDQRIVSANGLPSHTTGIFPVSRSDDAYAYDRNPNSIEINNVLLKLDSRPQVSTQPTCVPMGMIGFALSGAAIYNAVDARGQDAPAHEIQDSCDGHPERTGQYHYHNLSRCIDDTQSGPTGHSDLLGYALDGFGIFGSFEAKDRKLVSNDLDACHGHTSMVDWDGESIEIYHYHFTEDYPYTVGCFKGVVRQ